MKLSELIRVAAERMAVYGNIEVISDHGYEVTNIVADPITESESNAWDINQGEMVARIYTSE